ncbi:MAG: hypothetical protein ABIW84_05555 [Ilumatobacteraceae bacterium]
MVRPGRLDGADHEWATRHLLVGEAQLWEQMPVADQRHSVIVARRLVADGSGCCRDDVAAALLHDIGKLRSCLGVWARVAATVVGPRTRRFRLYHDHERLGAEMARTSGGSTARTVALIDGTSADTAVLAALRHADDV